MIGRRECDGGTSSSIHFGSVICRVWSGLGIFLSFLLKSAKIKALEFALAFLPEATASIKDALGPLGPFFQKKPLKLLLPQRQS